MSNAAAIAGVVLVGVGGALVLLLIALLSRAISARLPRYRVAEYVPPPGSILSHGLLVRAERRAFGAELLRMAVEGRVRVLAPRGKRGPVALEALTGAGFSPDDRWLLEVLKPSQLTRRQRRRHARGMRELGISACDVHDPDIYFLRGKGALRWHQQATLVQRFDEERERLRSEGLVKRFANGVLNGLFSLVFLTILTVLLACAVAFVSGGAYLALPVVVLAVVLNCAVLPRVAPPMLRFTEQGHELRVQLAGLREYVRLAESERLRFTQSPSTALRTPAGIATEAGRALGLSEQPTAASSSEQARLDQLLLTEKLLPYALLFNQQKQWANEFSRFASVVKAENLRALGTTVNSVVTVLDLLNGLGTAIRVFRFLVGLIGRSV